MVSGPFGSGMEELAGRLAHRLEVPFYDPHELETLASDREKHGDAWQDLKESEGDFFDYWLGYLHEGASLSAGEHLARLSTAIQEIATHGGVIAGFCSHMVLPGDNLFRIKVEAGAQFCSSRLASIHGIDREEARRVFLRLEEERKQFLHDLFEEELIDSIDYDLVLDAEETTIEKMLKICLAAMDRKGMISRARTNRFPDALFCL